MINRSILKLFKETAKRIPDAEALVYPKGKGQYITHTYEGLFNRVNQFSNYLISTHGIKPHDRIVLFTDKSDDTVLSTFTAFNIGATVVPVNISVDPSILKKMLAQLGDYSLITQPMLLDTVKLITSVNPILVGNQAFEEKLAAAKAEEMDLWSPNAYVIFTSGSTGVPKPVLCTHEGLYRVTQAWEKDYQLRTSGQLNHGQMAPPGFDVSMGDSARALGLGGKLVLIPSCILNDPAKLYQLIIEKEINIAEFVPVVLNQLMDWMKRHNKTINHPFFVIFGSDKVLMETPRRIKTYFTHPKTHNVNSYGATELFIDSYRCHNADLHYDYLGDKDPVPIGLPFDHAIGYIKTETGKTVVMKPNQDPILLDEKERVIPFPDDKIISGELLIGGNETVASYFNNNALNQEKFLEDTLSESQNAKVYSTGDQVCFHIKTSALSLQGRNTDFIKSGGQRIGIGVIQSVLLQHSKIKTCHIKASKDRPNHVECYIVENQPINYDEIAQQLSIINDGAVIAHMTIYTIDGIVEIRTPNQKVNYEIKGNKKALAPKPIRPENGFEEWLIERIAKILVKKSDQNSTKDEIKSGLGTQSTLPQLNMSSLETNILRIDMNERYQFYGDDEIEYCEIAKSKNIKSIANMIIEKINKKDEIENSDQGNKETTFKLIPNVNEKFSQKGMMKPAMPFPKKEPSPVSTYYHKRGYTATAWNRFLPKYQLSMTTGTSTALSILNASTVKSDLTPK
ncbi:MAG: AMP-binding protein [Gammaproteobacteria bacterium]|nr:AMP-binding protein [Gammaproteobacteria bacterium]